MVQGISLGAVRRDDFVSPPKKSRIDELSFFLIAIAFIIVIIVTFLGLHRFIFLSWPLVLIAYWRSFSKNKKKRSKENQAFTDAIPFINSTPQNIEEYVYLNCNKCTQLLQIPKRTSHIKVTCPICNYSFSVVKRRS